MTLLKNNIPFHDMKGTQQQLDELGIWLRAEIGKRRPLRTTWHNEIPRLCEDLCMVKCGDAQWAIRDSGPYPVEGEALYEACQKAWDDTIVEIHQQFKKIKGGERE